MESKSRKILLNLAILVIALGMAGVAKSAPMGTAFTYQGRLADANSPAEGLYDFEFKLYDQQGGGNQFGNTVTKDEVDVIDGHFMVMLDFVNDANVFDGDARWLQVGVRPGELEDPNTYSALSPRQELTPTPYALYAENAGGDGDWTISGNDMYSGVSGNVGIGTTNPEVKLEVRGDDNLIRARATTDFEDMPRCIQMLYHSSVGPLIQGDGFTRLTLDAWAGQAGEIQLGLNGDKVGIGTTSPATQLDVNGTITATGGDSDNWNTAYGWGDHAGVGYLSSGQSAGGDLGGTYPNPTVIGLTLPISETASSSSELLDIRNTLSSDDHAAIFGMHDVTDYFGFGVVGQGGYVGVMGNVAPIGSEIYYGVWGDVVGGTGTNYGVYGYAAGGTTNYAGYFDGNVDITGTLSKAAGSFKIDHPLDPENKYLNHSFVESPDMMNVYNGNVVLDNNGQAVVEMPDWFDALNRDCRYQITCIGGFAPVYIAQKIQNNTFKIAGGTAGLEVSWQVTGIRQDPYAETNRIQVEVDKPADERGKYLHAQAYGLEEGLSVGYEKKKHAETKWKKKETSKNY